MVDVKGYRICFAVLCVAITIITAYNIYLKGEIIKDSQEREDLLEKIIDARKEAEYLKDRSYNFKPAGHQEKADKWLKHWKGVAEKNGKEEVI